MGCKVPWYFSRMIVAACFMALALLLYSPATLMAASICLKSTFARASGAISNCFDRASKALAVLRSAVFCERIVVMRVSNGFLRDFVHLGRVNSCCSVCRMIAALSFVLSPLPSVDWFTEVNRSGYKYHLDDPRETGSFLFQVIERIRFLFVKCF
jgi:hypothetical protein